MAGLKFISIYRTSPGGGEVLHSTQEHRLAREAARALSGYPAAAQTSRRRASWKDSAHDGRCTCIVFSSPRARWEQQTAHHAVGGREGLWVHPSATPEGVPSL